jgi:hypothetical protein
MAALGLLGLRTAPLAGSLRTQEQSPLLGLEVSTDARDLNHDVESWKIWRKGQPIGDLLGV